MNSVFEIGGVPRDYAWGSTTAIQQLTGRPVDGQPLAELWFGTHPGARSPVGDTTLEALIAADPVALLGSSVAGEFAGQLPFLVKLLAAERALSIQVHPTLGQARAGFAREEAAGVPRDVPHRNYRDANHKPELLCALTPFEALCGFRPVARTRALLESLRLSSLEFVADALRGPDPLRTAFTAILTRDESRAVLPSLIERAAADPDGPLRGVHLAATDFPSDVGVVLALLLNYVRLGPGEAVYLGAGNVHAYLRGMGVEIMATSDNVLRCGLTPKHVDVPELLHIADFAELDHPRWPALRGSYAVPVPDFRLVRHELGEPTALDDPGPLIALCTRGALTVAETALTPGRAAFVPADCATRVDGTGELFVAAVGDLTRRSDR